MTSVKLQIDLIDQHISKVELIKSIQNHRIYIIYDDNSKFICVLRYNLFWDNTSLEKMVI